MIRPDDDALIAAVSEAARRIAAEDAAGRPAPGAWHRLEQRRAARLPRAGRRWAARAGFGAAAVAAALALVLGVRAWRTARPLTYAVGGGAVEEDGYIRGAETAGGAIRFSDGTRVELGAGARLSIQPPGPHGAGLRLEEGQARFVVNHLPKAAWSVEAGPFVVEVTGTVFDVRWSSAHETVEVDLHRGSVRVRGPLLAEHATLRAGQRLTAHLATREVRIDEGPTAGSAAPPTNPAPAQAAPPTAAAPASSGPPPVLGPPSTAAPAPADVARRRPTAAAHVVKPHGRRLALAETAGAASAWTPGTWATRVSAGDAASVVREAVAHGIDATVAEADASALVALADATRYTGRTYLAEQVLRAQRSRFPGTTEAATAAFFLGRIADDRGAAAEGLEWYRRSLAERPQGAYAAEALGREMLDVSRVSGRPAARTLAQEYLRRFPEGTYLLNARGILQSR